jgi:hypothetical protein
MRQSAFSISAVAKLGRFLQFLGLVIVPMGFLYGLERGPRAMSLELGLLAAGAAVFLIGLTLQRRGGGRG